MIDLRIKELFFDRGPVIKRVDQATRRVFSRFGAFVHRSAKSSIRKRKRPAAPGQPPSSHTGLLKKFIFFGYDPGHRSVVIGPAPLGSGTNVQAPPLLEYGGATTVEHRGRRKRANYPARPFMGPAFTNEQTKLPAMWRDSVRK